MKLIKRIEKGNKALEHHTYIDALGFKRDSFQLIETDAKGHMTLKPFLGPAKVQTYTRNTNIMDTTTKYTDEDYEEMFNQ